MQTPFHTVGLVGKYDNQGMEASVRALGEFLRGRGHDVLLACQSADHLGIKDFPTRSLHDLATESDVVVVLGGDGTMLSIARELAPNGAPLIGVNQGRLGFLTDITVEDMYDAIAEILSGQYVAEERILLNGQIRRDGEPVFVIAEIGINHNGSLDIARKLIDGAAGEKKPQILLGADDGDGLAAPVQPVCVQRPDVVGRVDRLGREAASSDAEALGLRGRGGGGRDEPVVGYGRLWDRARSQGYPGRGDSRSCGEENCRRHHAEAS